MRRNLILLAVTFVCISVNNKLVFSKNECGDGTWDKEHDIEYKQILIRKIQKLYW